MFKKIAILEGDGIGPEITAQGIRVLNTIMQKFKHEFECTYAPFGANAYFEHGTCFPDETISLCDQADAIIKGPVGLSVDKMQMIPEDKRPEKIAVLGLRERYQTYINYRPIVLPESFLDFSPLRREVISNGIKIMMIRELIGGIYFGKKIEGSETQYQYATDVCTYNYKQVENIANAAFQKAEQWNKRLINIHKANVLATSRFWNHVVETVAKNYPSIEYNSLLVDNAAFQLVKNPGQFNGVMLLENMQGDILTDLAGGIMGSLGLMPSACAGPEKGYVEPAHGSGPDIAGQNIANPYSMIGSIALLFSELFFLPREADYIWQALKYVFGNGYRTKDLVIEKNKNIKIVTTTEFGDLVIDFLEKNIS